MPKANTLKRIERLETAGNGNYFNTANRAHQAGRITKAELDLYLNFIEAGNAIPPIQWIDADSELTRVLQKLGIYPESVWI